MYILWDLRNPHPFLLHDLGSKGSVLTRATPQHWPAVPLAGISDNKSWQWGKLRNLVHLTRGKDSGSNLGSVSHTGTAVAFIQLSCAIYWVQTWTEPSYIYWRLSTTSHLPTFMLNVVVKLVLYPHIITGTSWFKAKNKDSSQVQLSFLFN